MGRAPLVLIAVLVLCATLAGCSASKPAQGADLHDTIESVADDLGAQGMAVEVVDANGVVGSAITGVDGDGAPIGVDTPFVWGSVSKSFTGMIVSRLADRGLLELDAPVTGVLPETANLLDPATTVSDLLHHTSGLPHDITRTDDWDRRQPASASVGDLHGVAVGQRGTFGYSSLNYLLLQAVIERVTGRPFGESVRREIAEPAGANDIITDAATFEKLVPAGTVPFFTFSSRSEIGFDEAGLGYGYLAGSVDELGKYASFQLRDLASDAPDAVARRTDTFSTGDTADYGLGWYVEQVQRAEGGSTEMRWHSGAVPGYFTHIAVLPEIDRAIVIVANRYGELEADRMAQTARSLTKTLLGEPLSIPPRPGFYEGLLAALMLVCLALAVWLVRLVSALVRRRLHPRSTRHVVLIGVIAIAVGVLAPLAGLIGIDVLAGAPVSVIDRWAPDVALLFWILLAEIVLIAVLVLLRAALSQQRWIARFAR